MTDLSFAPVSLRPPVWRTAAVWGGLAWNLFGAVQFVGTLTATETSLIDTGLTPEQAAVMTGYPAWMTVAFGVGVFGGLAGCALLLLRHTAAQMVLLVSLVAYVALWIGDAVHGVFAAMGMPQVVILTTVVLIAAALYALARAMPTKS